MTTATTKSPTELLEMENAFQAAAAGVDKRARLLGFFGQPERLESDVYSVSPRQVMKLSPVQACHAMNAELTAFYDANKALVAAGFPDRKPSYQAKIDYILKIGWEWAGRWLAVEKAAKAAKSN
jgi:hypothetical protein